MNWTQKIEILDLLGQKLNQWREDLDFLHRVESHNPWFIPQFTKTALENIASQYLDKDKLETWITKYSISKYQNQLGLILAGNLPLVGFHDILCAYFCIEKLHIKLSSKDNFLTKKILEIWGEIDPEWKTRFQIVDKIELCDKIIATGSNNSHRYFEYYFKKYKHILRKNRTSVGIITKSISEAELESLMDDIFLYFGLGCRNISKLWIEKGFELGRIFEASEKYSFLFNHQKYMNNYDYQRTLLLLNKIPHLSNNFLMLKEDSQLYSPISVLHYQFYENKTEYQSDIDIHKDEIQCLIGQGYIPFGLAQSPELEDYADGIDTMRFLIEN